MKLKEAEDEDVLAEVDEPAELAKLLTINNELGMLSKIMGNLSDSQRILFDLGMTFEDLKRKYEKRMDQIKYELTSDFDFEGNFKIKDDGKVVEAEEGPVVGEETEKYIG